MDILKILFFMIKRDELLSKHPGKQNYQGIENFISIPGNRKMIRKRNWSRWDQVFGINCELLHGSIPMTREASWLYRLNRVIFVGDGSFAAGDRRRLMLVTTLNEKSPIWHCFQRHQKQVNIFHILCYYEIQINYVI